MDIALLIAALIVSFLVFTWLIKVVKATLSTALTLAIVVLAFQLFYGFGFQDIVQPLGDFLRRIWAMVTGGP